MAIGLMALSTGIVAGAEKDVDEAQITPQEMEEIVATVDMDETEGTLIATAEFDTGQAICEEMTEADETCETANANAPPEETTALTTDDEIMESAPNLPAAAPVAFIHTDDDATTGKTRTEVVMLMRSNDATTCTDEDCDETTTTNNVDVIVLLMRTNDEDSQKADDTRTAMFHGQETTAMGSSWTTSMRC